MAPRPAATWRLLDDATTRLLATAAGLSDADCRAPSLLPGWSRGHVLTHVARNADALATLLSGAAAGRPVQMYPSVEARDAAVQSGAGRPAAELVADLRGSAARLREIALSLDGSAWQAVQEWRHGRRRPASDVAGARLTEVELHHIDLGVDRGLADVPDQAADVLLDEALARLVAAGITEPFRARVDNDDGVRDVGEVSGSGVTVSGTRQELVGWLTGRADGSALRCDGDRPRLPPWD